MIRFEGKGVIPDWIEHNDWDAESRLDWAKKIMEMGDYITEIASVRLCVHPDPLSWAIWCLLAYAKKEEALNKWWSVQ